MSRALVTGGAGFIGSHVVDRLIAAGHTPRILDVRPSEHHSREEVETVLGDVRELGAVRAAVAGCDAVIHLAAAADVADVAQEPVRSEHLNAGGTVNVLQAARDAGLRRVVYASTVWVYSDVDGQGADEDTPLRPPAHLYTATKLAGELYCRSYTALYGLECTILRFGIPYGPRSRPSGVVPTFVRKALAGEPLTIAGSGEQSRRFVYVEDLADGVVRALAPAAANRTYNLVGDEDVSVRAIAETVQRHAGRVGIVHARARAADFHGVEVSGARAARELAWRPKVDFDEGVRRCVEWQRGRRPEPATVPVPRTVRRRVPAARAVALAVLGALVGVVAVAATRIGMFSDASSVMGMLVLLGLPLMALAPIDWTQDRRAAALLAGSGLVGVGTALLLPLSGAVLHLARRHVVMLVLVGAGVAGLMEARRRLLARA